MTNHHDDYHHVSPSHHDHHGTFYTHNDTHYYYEAAPVAYRPGVQVAMRPSTRIQPRAVEFGGFSHVDDLSARLESLSNEFCLDLHFNYQHDTAFRKPIAKPIKSCKLRSLRMPMSIGAIKRL